MTQLKQVVATYVRDRLKELETDPNDGRVRAQLAILRHGVGRKPGDMPELWGLFFAEMNPLMFSQDGEPTPAEWAAYTALTLYAVHQQGREISEENMHKEGEEECGLGRAVARLIENEEDDRERIAKRLNAFAMAGNIQGAAHYLRGLIQLLHAKRIPLDYVKLAEELYDFQNPDHVSKVRLGWGQDFYYTKMKNKEDDKQKGQEDSDA